jgi:predicted RNA polymerase sigma factor
LFAGLFSGFEGWRVINCVKRTSDFSERGSTMAYKFCVVTLTGYGDLRIVAESATFEATAAAAKHWASSNLGKRCWIIERVRMVACDELREVNG